MRWFWTDDLAALLVEHGFVGSERLREWTERPVAYAVPDETEGLDVARSLIGDEPNSDAA